MKFLVILIFMIGLVTVFSIVFYSILGESTGTKKRKNVRNFKVRFDAAKEKYYIVNELDTHDEPVTNSFGFRVMYKDKPKAEFVAEKYNA